MKRPTSLKLKFHLTLLIFQQQLAQCDRDVQGSFKTELSARNPRNDTGLRGYPKIMGWPYSGKFPRCWIARTEEDDAEKILLVIVEVYCIDEIQQFPDRNRRPRKKLIAVIMVPRMSYFPLILPRVLQYFATVLDQFNVESVWLQYNTKPLKWHYPVGVLMDLLKTDDLLPWTIVLKTKDFPKEVMPYKGNDLASSFIQSIKEADQLKHRARIVNSMKVDEHKQLWNSLVHDKFDEFWSINKKLMEASENEPLLHVPIRIYEIDCPFRQPLITPYDESGKALTIRDALKAVNIETETEVISHGISIPSTTPLIWMLQNLSYLDNFIHVVVKALSTAS